MLSKVLFMHVFIEENRANTFLSAKIRVKLTAEGWRSGRIAQRDVPLHGVRSVMR